MVFHDEPIQTVLVTTRGHSNILGRQVQKDNIITVDWHMPVSFRPAMYAISIGKDRFSLDLIRDSKCFVVNFIGGGMEAAALHCGRSSGLNTDKWKENDLIPVDAEKIDCPRVRSSIAYLECEVVQEVEAGDHILFIARILAGEKMGEGGRLFHLSGDKFITIGG